MFRLRLPGRLLCGLALVLCAACALVRSPADNARRMAQAAGFVPVDVGDARLSAFAKQPVPAAGTRRVTVYFESDGAPWRFPDEPPADPTPLQPVVLRMAIADPSAAVAYLGRPCQYLGAAELAHCDPQLWMRGRFRDEAVAAMSAAVDRLKREYAVAEVNLVGYSGGGAMAALVAARRSDVSCLVTVAAPLDTRAWTAAIGVSALDLSLNPADEAGRLAAVRQTHFRGARDRSVPAATLKRYLERAPHATVIDMASFDHRCCWDDAWGELVRRSCLAP